MNIKLRLLILEDRPTDAELMLREIRRAGYEPEWKRVETQADYLAQLDQGWEIILADYNLPQFTGLRALELLKERGLDIPFILISGTIGEEKAVTAMKAGASDYLMKDRLARLGPAIERVLHEAGERCKGKRVEQVLSDSELRYRRLFESAKDGILILDAETGMVVDVNPFLIELLGYTHETFLGKKVWELGFFKDIVANQASFTELQKKEYIRYEDKPLETSDGRRVQVEFVSNVYLVKDRKVIQCDIRDITERKQAAANQQLALEALRLLNRPNNLPVLVGELMRLIQSAMGFDAVGLRIRQGDDFPYYVQNGFSDAFVKEENFLCAKGKDAAILRAPDGKAVLECTCGLVLSGRTDPSLPCFTKGGSFWSNKSSELLALAPAADPRTNPRNRCIHDRYESFALIPLRSGDAIIGLLQLNDRRRGRFTPELILFFEGLAASVGIALKRRQAQDAMHEREADLELAQQIGQIGSWESDLAAGTLVWSKESYRIFGCDPAAFVPTREGFFQLVHPDDRARVREAVEESIRSGADYELDHRIRWPNGTERVVHEKGHLLRDAQEKAERLVGTTQDITERKNLEMQFLRAQRLEAVGTLAGGIAHDLNNILAPIRMVAPFLREAQTPAEMAENVDIIEASTQRATDVVRQLLTFSRGQSSQRIPLDLKHLLRDLRSVLHETFPKNITFALSEAPDLWPLLADPTQLHQILINLCINARDAMLEGGTMAVTAANFQADDHYAGMVADARPGPYVLLTVSDTGSGIRPEDLDKIFDPFFTTKEVGKGTGLGLATVHRVVTGHGGFVRVRSQVGRGTTFDVYLPASPEAVAPAEPALPTPLPAGHGQLIMVVDDEEPIRQITQKTLVRHGYQVVTANDGTDAIAVFVRHQAEVKGVVTDLMMPGMDALGLVKVLAQMKPGLPVILSTGLGEDPEQNQRFEALGRLGVSIVLTKPYTADELLNALQAVLPRSEPLNP